jgi:Rrf2 family protein
MKLNTRVRYAIRMMADIAKTAAAGPVPLKDVADRQGLSKLYLSQLATPLRNAGLLKSVWGNKGGYILGRPADQINLLEIMEAVDGRVSLIECVAEPGGCERAAFCETIDVWRDINTAVTRVLERYTLRDLTDMAPPAGATGMACFPGRVVSGA